MKYIESYVIGEVDCDIRKTTIMKEQMQEGERSSQLLDTLQCILCLLCCLVSLNRTAGKDWMLEYGALGHVT